MKAGKPSKSLPRLSHQASSLWRQDYADTELLLSRENVDQEALLNYAREAADFSTQQQLPSLDFAINHYGQPDVAMFDFTCMYASENAALVREQNGHQLLVALVGDSLLEVSSELAAFDGRGNSRAAIIIIRTKSGHPRCEVRVQEWRSTCELPAGHPSRRSRGPQALGA